ncbi:MAG: Uma2 family endonuclease [Leptospiraceae bacterium]|nr:Uma2 family endonuclease [Leptospiraceae bacterium]
MELTSEKKTFTSEEYLELERKAEFKSELINGEMYAMAGVTRKHNRIALNVASFLNNFLQNKPCRIYFADLRVQVSKTGLFTYPDLVITCGNEMKMMGDKYKDTLLNPKCILEVLSDSTEKYDRGEKFSHYQNLESLEEYILISQNQTKVESFLRQADNKWLYQKVEGSESELSIHSIETKIKLEEIYRNTEELEDNLNS